LGAVAKQHVVVALHLANFELKYAARKQLWTFSELRHYIIRSSKIRVVCATAGYFALLSQAFLVVVLPNLHLMTAT
jgi:hypothetical protein